MPDSSHKHGKLSQEKTSKSQHTGNEWVFLSIFLSTRKCNRTHSMGENLGSWLSYFGHSLDAFFPSDSHLMLYFITWEMHGFSYPFPMG